MDEDVKTKINTSQLFEDDANYSNESESKIFLTVTAQHHSYEFANWLKEKAIIDSVSDHVFWLAKGSRPIVKRYKGYYVNGYSFYTKTSDSRCKTQNSGVTLAALTSSFASSKDQNPIVGDVIYYGAILEIIEIDYWFNFHLILIRCEWYHAMNDNYGLICVNKNKLCYVNDPFVRPSQVHQVFYVGDPEVDGMYYVLNKVPKYIFDFNMDKDIDDGNSFGVRWTIQVLIIYHNLAMKNSIIQEKIFLPQFLMETQF